MLFCGPTSHVVTGLREEIERSQRPHSGKALDVDAAEDALQRIADVEGDLIAPRGEFGRFVRAVRFGEFSGYLAKHGLDAVITFFDVSREDVVQAQCLLQREEVLGLVVATQCFDHDFLGRAATRIAVLS